MPKSCTRHATGGAEISGLKAFGAQFTVLSQSISHQLHAHDCVAVYGASACLCCWALRLPLSRPLCLGSVPVAHEQAKILRVAGEGVRLPLAGDAAQRIVDDARNGPAAGVLEAPLDASEELTDAALFIDASTHQLGPTATTKWGGWGCARPLPACICKVILCVVSPDAPLAHLCQQVHVHRCFAAALALIPVRSLTRHAAALMVLLSGSASRAQGRTVFQAIPPFTDPALMASQQVILAH